jgi:predicted patatin/cPLA2 family phospholipase
VADSIYDKANETVKTGLILEGGAMRGMFTCGVIDVLMQHGISFDGAAGISAGAVFGCNYKSGQIGRPIRYNQKRLCRSAVLQHPVVDPDM